MTRAGLPILTIPESDPANIFSMLVYSLINFTDNKKRYMHYDISDKKLYVRLGEKSFIALYVPNDLENAARNFMEISKDLINRLDSLIVEEGVIDHSIIEDTKHRVIARAIRSGLPIASLNGAIRKMCGEIYQVLIETGEIYRSFAEKFRIGYFPKIIDHTIVTKEKDPTVKMILELCDGEHSLRYIHEALGVPEAKLYRFIARLIRNGKLILTAGYELKG